ncbi:MAG: hypothetical protein WC606_04230 [Candidatus Absconditabacterales bacterium]
MKNIEILGDGEVKIINMGNHERHKAVTPDKELMGRFYALSDHLDDKNSSANKPTMKVVYKIIDQATLDAFYALSDHLDQ